ncbi:DNA-binding transcriptional regulator, LysR family [Litoreibacter ascidiaceicola]|uniref:DNA-binding transcriptional regulator, LysR family n=1 Tax=Litoreibacter ascidiaceicola TaxID=1486859 RepID=A0A1M4ZT55_9RHOB|nr:LysR family transcriptional regulator [Litoreibacter ascidiaceicola]SHF20962.1 DNA-binding transcriptional regulator, LysR family [Litoreibacter ascidiaceicola]
MQTRALETLVRILQVQSFSEAAQLQNMTLSALSMQMKALEAELDAELFDRSFRPPRLTPLGRKVAEQAKGVISAVDALHDLSSAGAGLSGAFKLGFIQSASARILPKFVTLAGEREPRATFRYSSNLSEVLTEQVVQGQLDAAIVTRVEGAAQCLHADLIASEPMGLAVPMGQSHMRVEHLPQHMPFIHFRPSTGIGKLIAASLGAGVSPKNTLVLDSIEACMECVKEGVGYTVLPLPDIRRYEDARVHVVENALEGLTRDLVMLTRDDSQAQRWRPRLLSLVRSAA